MQQSNHRRRAAAKALANIGRPGPKPEKGSKGFGPDRQLRRNPRCRLSQTCDTRLRSNRLDMDQVVATTFRDELRKMLEQARRKQLCTRSGCASGPNELANVR